eukprot:gene14390-16982_t
MTDSLQQLQPFLLHEELKQHQAASLLQQYKQQNVDQYLKLEDEYYVRKAKELRTLCCQFVQNQRDFVTAIDFNPEFDTPQAQALAAELQLSMAIIRTLHDSVTQLAREYEFVVSYNLLNRLDELSNVARHLAVLLRELESLCTGCGCPGAVLIIARQPFPGILKRYKQIPADELVVEMLTTSQFPYTYGKLKIHHAADNSINYTPNKKMTTNQLFESQTFDIQLENNRYLAKVPIKFIVGTTQFSQISFSLNLIHKSTKHQVVIETERSDKFISFVNDSQWVEYFILLLKEEIYYIEEGKYLYEEVSHTRVISILEKYFHLCLRIYKRSTSHHRPLPIEPLKALLNKISENKISIPQFDTFMSILAPSLKVIKYQRHVLELWSQGLIFYFIDNEEVKQYLLGKEKRFLLQFSPDHPYIWIVKYCSGGEIKEMHIDMKIDLTGDRSSKSVVNYIETNPEFAELTEICQYDYKLNTISFVNKEETLNLVKLAIK